jgi:hypothetical protein
MSPSEGSLSDTSSMRACDIVCCLFEGSVRRGGVEMVGFSNSGRRSDLKRARDEMF